MEAGRVHTKLWGWEAEGLQEKKGKEVRGLRNISEVTDRTQR